MLSEKMESALNEHLNAELYSSYLYFSMEAYCTSLNLMGFANWMRVQVQEEMTHSMKFYDFINERGGRVTLKTIAEPPKEWKDTMEVFEAVLEHERKVTGLINNLVNLAIEEKDHATNNFLQWFVTEQVEEEASVDDVLQKLKLMEGAAGGLFMIDQELAKRVFTPPAAGNN